ncbi:hypothetical protein [Enterobacter cloacae]|uniref:hypothetical protein n=1 Tax=Enterobacter cloacae TaxID=550 RepID=UPI003D247BB0
MMSTLAKSKNTGRTYEILDKSYVHGWGWCYLVRSLDVRIKPFHMPQTSLTLISEKNAD